MNVIISSVSGKKISDNKCRKKLTRKLGLPVRRVSRGHAIRTRILKSKKSSWTYTNRKTRSDAITPDTKKRIYEFWCKPGISRPTGNKANIKRVRIGPKTYSSHMTHILEKNTDRYNECYSTPVYDSISDVVNATLCENVEGSHNLQCLKRNCSDCGVKILNFLPCELDVSDTAEFVKWEQFENVNVNVKGNKTIKKLMLVKKESQVGELFSYFRKLIETFPVHQHRASWQNEQFQKLVVRNLPEKQCVCVRDFSENYRCSELTEIQTFFVISQDLVHDQYFVHQVQNYIAEYLQSISYSVETMHEFTEWCAAQYKSRHCFGDISQTSDDFGYQHFTRNFFETSHAKVSNSIKTGGYTEWEKKREYRADAQENEQVSLQELVSFGQLTALYTDDDEEEYYMLKVEKSMETLRIDTTDSWGSLLPAGTPMFRGLYYNKRTRLFYIVL
ncbi:Hypothetical predicted protein [Mytilus galloprovincialis]|uniref:Uncharacterized protein n=1 Tax=Mytilus galloprovincialis TaxID=29158 RepID=A0A8B6GZR4_MYTGA|nr:Hypothetical predicted protein [Mytilus galloprovincialis]